MLSFFHTKKQALASVEYITDTIIPKKSGPHSWFLHRWKSGWKSRKKRWRNIFRNTKQRYGLVFCQADNRWLVLLWTSLGLISWKPGLSDRMIARRRGYGFLFGGLFFFICSACYYFHLYFLVNYDTITFGVRYEKNALTNQDSFRKDVFVLWTISTRKPSKTLT